MDIKVCDLCGMPLDFTSRRFKIKELKEFRNEYGRYGKWKYIDVHKDCLNKLFAVVICERKEKEDGR